MTQFLTQEQIKCKAPSAFTEGSSDKTSSKYSPISTYHVLQGLFDMGFGVTHAMESNTRRKSIAGFGKHMIRLRRENEEEINGNFPELVLINAHDGSSSYQLRAGVYRMVCSNGMVVGNDQFFQKVRHQGDVIKKVAEAGGEIIEVFPTVIDKAEKWSKIQLHPMQQIAFANAAKTIRWDKDGDIEVQSQDLITPTRIADNRRDLWTTFNVIQEKIIKGGVVTRNKITRDRRRSREVKSPYENTKLNTALWQLAEEMASLAK